MNLSRFCRESIDSKSTSMDWDFVENLSTRQKFLDGSRSYRDKFQKARWIKIALTSVEKRSPRGSIDKNLLRICWEAVELEEKKVFQREEKHIEMNATSKLLNHRSNQHVKLSKTSLNKKMQSIQRSNTHTHTHTHTLNKSNQFYISKTIWDSLVSIH